MEENSSLQLDLIKDSIAELCSFSLGKEQILNLEPSYDPLLIKRECQRSEEALRCCVKMGPCNFYGIKDVLSILKTATRDGICTPLDCVRIADLIRGCSAITQYFKSCELSVPALKELSDSLVLPLSLMDHIEKCFNPYGEVLDSASPLLREIRKKIKQVEISLNAAAAKFVQSNATRLTDSVSTTRNGRVCVLAKSSEKNSMGGFIHGESASGQSAYVEPGALIPLNNERQSLIAKQEDEIERILFDVSQMIKKEADVLEADLNTCAILDAIFAKAEWGRKYDGCIAALNRNGRFYIKKARHPLIDQKKVVANTYRLEKPTKLLLITGPNTGGKTVSLKIIGLFVIMTYCGIPLPCEEAEIPFYDHVFVDIGDDQSIEESLSTFSAHLFKLSNILENATSDSLVLVDEIGSGTDPKEGEALAISILNELRNRGCNIVATTHYGRLKAYGKKHDDILLASVQFDVEKLLPTYRFIEGLTGQSNAFDIARRFNLQENVIKYAIFLKNQAKSEEEILIEKLEKQTLENEQLKENLQLKQDELSQLTDQVQKQIEEFNTQKDKLLEEAKKKADEYVENIKETADDYLSELKEKSSVGIKQNEITIIKHGLNELLHTESDDEESDDKPFKVGDSVLVKNSNQVGVILAINRKNVQVDLNNIKINTKLSELKHTSKKREIVKNKKEHKEMKPFSFSTECNIIGCYAEEGIQIVDKYLDDAILAKAKVVRIVHGSGSGALRTAVHTYLRKNKAVASFEIAPNNQGGGGATIVTLR